MGLVDHDAYAAELADFFIVVPQDDAMAAKVAQDFAAAGVDYTDYEIRLKMVELLFAPQAESLAA